MKKKESFKEKIFNNLYPICGCGRRIQIVDIVGTDNQCIYCHPVINTEKVLEERQKNKEHINSLKDN